MRRGPIIKGLQEEEEALMVELGASDMTDLEELNLDEIDAEIKEIEEE